ncbi:MAG: M81 family metallopeptidase, partial [Oscillospiraceae bacterium]|nr:M81 family metallopeptidase [Oscillospiraceae bacterium]
MSKKYRVLVCEYHQESNTFNPIISPLEKFNPHLGIEGEKVLNIRMASRSAVHGAVDAITAAGGEVIPSVFLTAGSGGRMADSILQLACEKVRWYIERAGEFDGVYVELHGATCTESEDDASGVFLRCIRELIGDKPMTASCDLHANITRQMMEMADAISGYQTYPHVDHYETGHRAGSLLMELLAGKKLVTATVSVPMLIPPSGYTTMTEPFRSLIARGKEMVAEGKLLDFSTFAVQPWLDIPELASTAMAVSTDPEMAKACAEELAQMLFDTRDAAQPELFTVDAIIDIAEANKEDKPVIVCDSADSPNGGAVGDSPVVGMRLLERGSKLRAAMFIKDPEATDQAFALGVGGEAEF